jgi:tRNA A-37 threonylcarbamoyl transferase component Bud32/tetratricopeptide (TPR) repeat protein
VAPQDLPANIGRYQVTGRLGYGGMGVVYRARDPRIGRSVAIKLLSLRDEALRVRFQQEAQSAGNLKHPNIVTVYDYGEHEEQPYIVMEFIEGVTLSQHIRQGIPLSLPRKLALIEDLSLALDYAHNKGIVHRDIKPANVMVDGDGVLKILDFGIARIGDSNLTQVGVMVGTPNYMSPEQILGETADRRSDIFAVGLVFYELLSYKRAFPGDSPIAVMHAITQSKPEPLEKLCPDLHPSVIAIVAKALEKEPSRRYQNLAALAADITLFKNLSWTGRGAQVDQPTVHWTGPALTPLPERKTTPYGTERERVIRRRAEKLEEHLDTAQRAFDTGQFGAAVDACEQAEVIDPDEPRVADLLTRARKALTAESVRNLIKQAKASLEQQHPDEAAEFVARALQEAPSSVEARQAQHELEEYRRRAQIDAERRQTIEGSLARARSSLARGDLDSAIRAAGEVLAQDPSNATAHAITRDALVAADERRQREAWEQAAQAAVREQKQAFAAGRWHEAIAALERFAPRWWTSSARRGYRKSAGRRSFSGSPIRCALRAPPSTSGDLPRLSSCSRRSARSIPRCRALSSFCRMPAPAVPLPRVNRDANVRSPSWWRRWTGWPPRAAWTRRSPRSTPCRPGRRAIRMLSPDGEISRQSSTPGDGKTNWIAERTLPSKPLAASSPQELRPPRSGSSSRSRRPIRSSRGRATSSR